jgi:MFS family permease
MPLDAKAAPGLAPATRLLLALALMTGASQFHRAALGVVGPELAAALAAGPGLLGAANGAFFLALLLLQVPVGLALDRIGPRRTVAGWRCRRRSVRSARRWHRMPAGSSPRASSSASAAPPPSWSPSCCVPAGMPGRG